MREGLIVPGDITRRGLLAAGTALGTLGAMPAWSTGAHGATRLPPPWKPRQWPSHRVAFASAEHSRVARMRAQPVHRALPLLELDRADAWRVTPIGNMEPGRPKPGSRRPSFTLSTPMADAELMKQTRSPAGDFVGGFSYVRDGEGATYWRHRWATPQDWRGMNRISLWIRPHDTGLAAYRLVMALVTAGATANASDPLPFHFVEGLTPGKWNHVVWTFDDLPRNKVTEFAILQPLIGPLGARAAYDVADFTLERVDAEPHRGWAIPADRIAFNHLGYAAAGPKLAHAAPAGETFEVIEDRTGKVALNGRAVRADSRIGTFVTLDFSSLAKPGRYRLRYGAVTSGAFDIAQDLHGAVVDNLLNFFYADRCGCAVPGIHDVCHKALFAEHRGVRKSINGGWHDAGNFCQGAYRTALATSALLTLYEAREGIASPRQQRRVLEEACWGLDWLLGTRFGDGYRVGWSSYAVYQADPPAPVETMVFPAASSDMESVLFAGVAMHASRLLERLDPMRAADARRAGIEDYGVAAPRLLSGETRHGRTDEPHAAFAFGIVAALALHRATGEPHYRDEALRFAELLLALQQQGGDNRLGITGYYHHDAAGRRRVQDYHMSFAQAPSAAFEALIAAFPEHPDRVRWHAAVALESECFHSRGAAPTAPFNHLPAGVWKEGDIKPAVAGAAQGIAFAARMAELTVTPLPDIAGVEADLRAELAASLEIARGEWLRTFPIPQEQVFHGNTNMQLARAVAVTTAARLRRDPALDRLAIQQFDWIHGANPFSMSLIAGVGYDHAAQMLMWSNDIRGAVPVGMDSLRDEPFWPHTTHMTSREMWVVPAGYLALLAAQLGGAARVSGTARVPAELVAAHDGQRHPIARGDFDLRVPPGRYAVRAAGRTLRSIDLGGGERRQVVIDPAHILRDAKLSVADGRRIAARIDGTGTFRFRLEGHNLQIDQPERAITLDGEAVASWQIIPADRALPWVAMLRDTATGELLCDLVSPA
jgi:hypothetical protein